MQPDARPIAHRLMNVEAEQQVLGHLLLNETRLDGLGAMASPELFADPVHGRIFDQIAQRHRAGEFVSPVTLRLWAEGDEGMMQLGGPAYLVRLAGCAMAGFAFGDYVVMLDRLRQKRVLAAAAERALAELQDDASDAGMVSGRLEAAIAMGRSGAADNLPLSATAATTAALARVKDAQDGKQAPGVRCGIPDLDDIVPVLRPSQLILLGGRPSMGKAQPLDAMVMTASGRWVRMGDITIGTEIASEDGRRSLVSGVFPQGVRDVYLVTFSDGRSVRCCADHLWAVESSKFAGRKVWSTSDIAEKISTERYRSRLRVPLVSGHFGSDRDIAIDPWLLGALIGDGCLTNTPPRISTPDAQILFGVQAAIGDGMAVTSSGGYDYRLRSSGGVNGLTAELRRAGLHGCRSEQKFIPENYLSASRETRLAVLQGILDTDGWVEKFGAIRFATSSPRLADDVASLVRSLGGVCSISSKPTSHLTSYVLNIRHHDGGSFLRLVRKKRRAIRTKPVRLTISSVDKCGTEPVQCISVTHPSRTYITDGFTVTHNTAVALEIAANAAAAGFPVCFASLEMQPDDMMMRLMARGTGDRGQGVPYAAFETGSLREDQYRAVVSAGIDAARLPIEFLPPSYRDVGALFAGAKQVAAKHGYLGLVVVDYLQLLRSPAKSRYEQITDISMSLKLLAMQLKVPVLALTQLSRQCESRGEDKRPQMQDLRDSGQLEQDADTIMFCFREEYYLEREEPRLDGTAEASAKHQSWSGAMEAQRNRLEIIVAKQRQGRIGTAHLRFNPALNLFWGD